MVAESLVGRKVIRANQVDDVAEPPQGKVVSVNQDRFHVWVLWPFGKGDPHRHPFRELMLVKEDMGLTKTMKWSGKTLGALEKFVEQVRVEGGDEDTVLNPGKPEHVGIVVELPLATKPPTKQPGTIENPFPNPADFVTIKKAD
jgi:hypothetical protein